MSSLLSSLKRQPALRSRSSPKASSSRKPSASTKTRRLSILPEVSEDDESFGVLAEDHALVSSTGRKRLSPSDIFVDEATVFEHPRPAPRPPRRAPSANQPVRLSAFDFDMAVPASAPKKAPTNRASKRLSRYGKEELDVFSCPAELDESDALPSPSPQRSSKRLSRYGKAELGFQEKEDVFSAARASVRLSAFEFDFPADVDSDSAPSTPVRSQSPTSSLSSDYTSSSVTSGGGLPLTPTTSDDEWSVPCPRVPIRPLVIKKTTPDAQPTLVIAQDEDEEEDGIWYTRELGSRFNLGSPLCLPAAAPSTHGSVRPDSLPPPRRGDVSCRSRLSKPLPTVPRTLGPSAQLDPTFSSLPPPLPSSPPPSHLSARIRTSTRVRKSLTITVPRPPPRSSVPADVADILDDIAAWELTSLAPTSGSGLLSPPRLPESPWSVFSVDADADVPVQAVNGDAAILETRSAAVPAVPTLPTIVVSALESPSVPETTALAQTTATASSPLADDERDEYSEESFAFDSPVLRSRWSSSTLSSLVDAPQSASSRILHFPFGAVAKRVRRSKRVSAVKVKAPPPVEVESSRSSIESSVSDGASESGESSASSGLRRKPIPLEIFLR